jgi:NifU-like protein involved in Fe-S cluster formation
MYSATVRRLIAELPNQGRLPDAVSGSAENQVCGDLVEIHLVVNSAGVVEQSRFQAGGCPAAIAAAAAVAVLVEGKSRQEAGAIGVEQVLEYLEGLPPHKRHGAEMAVRALRQALRS